MSDKRGRDCKRASETFSVRVQNKLINQFAKKGIRKKFLSDEVAAIVDDLYYLFKVHSKDRGFADRVVTSAVKTGLQIKMRVCNRLWNKNDLAGLDSFGHNLVSFLQHVVWFSEGHQRYDREFLLDGLKTIEETVKSLIRNHFSQHALGELEEVLIVLQNPKCLDAAFTQGSPENKYMKNIGMTIKSALISGGLMKQEETVTVGK